MRCLPLREISLSSGEMYDPKNYPESGAYYVAQTDVFGTMIIIVDKDKETTFCLGSPDGSNLASLLKDGKNEECAACHDKDRKIRELEKDKQPKIVFEPVTEQPSPYDAGAQHVPQQFALQMLAVALKQKEV